MIEEQSNQKININKIIFNNQRAAAKLFVINVPTINNLIVANNKSNVQFIDPLHVYFEDKIVNTDTDLVFLQKDDTWVIRITFLDENTKFDSNLTYFLYPVVQSTRIGCVTCKNYYSHGQSACACIEHAPNIYIEDVIVNSIHIVERNSNINTKSELFRDFFGGAISKLTILELI